MLRVVVGRLRVFAHVQPGEAAQAAPQRGVVRIGEALQDRGA
ncbi:MAG TPA: hypothetical protein VNK05_06035 [Chloroflexota bacterium]|nr:hypothetical protein [Chloroflexota bacterium]